MSFTSMQSPTPQWQTYLDLQLDAKPYLQFPVNGVPNIVQDQTMQMLLDSACWWVQDYLARPIGPTEFFRRFDGWAGWNGSYIMLPYYPVLEIIECVEYWGLSGPIVLYEQTPQEQYGVGQGPNMANNTYQLDPIDGKIIRSFPGLVQRPFFPGSRNVEVKWVAGYNPVPPDIKLATLELFAWWYRNTQEDPRMTGGGRYGGGGDEKNELWPAVPNRVTVMLEAYLQQGMA